MATQRLAIVGGDAAGMSAASIARRRDDELEIVAFERGPYTSYSACGIPYYVAGLVADADRLTKICRDEVGRTGIGEREAADAGIEVVSATIKDRTRAGYYLGAGPIWVKLVAEPDGGRLLGGQIVGVEGAAKRIDVLATAVWAGIPVQELALLDLFHAPPFSGVYDPLLVAARATAKLL